MEKSSTYQQMTEVLTVNRIFKIHIILLWNIFAEKLCFFQNVPKTPQCHQSFV